MTDRVDRLHEIGREALATAIARGWLAARRRWGEEHPRQASPFERTSLIGTEVAEALECLRVDPDPTAGYVEVDGKPEGYASELADIIIRTCELAADFDIDLDAVVVHKQAYNRTRPTRHGGKEL